MQLPNPSPFCALISKLKDNVKGLSSWWHFPTAHLRVRKIPLVRIDTSSFHSLVLKPSYYIEACTLYANFRSQTLPRHFPANCLQWQLANVEYELIFPWGSVGGYRTKAKFLIKLHVELHVVRLSKHWYFIMVCSHILFNLFTYHCLHSRKDTKLSFLEICRRLYLNQSNWLTVTAVATA